MQISPSPDKVVNQILSEMEWLAQQPRSTQYSYVVNKKKNPFVARQPDEHKKWRWKIKNLFRSYLSLKFKTETTTFTVSEPSKKTTRFKIKVDGQSQWFTLQSDRLSCGEKVTEISMKEDLLFQDALLSRIFRGSHLEYIHEITEKKLPDSLWSGWKTNMLVLSYGLSFLPCTLQEYVYWLIEKISYPSPAWVDYQTVIHPLLEQVSLHCLQQSKQFSQKKTVVELCSGGGELANKIISKYTNPLTYYLLEWNDRSRNSSKQLLKPMRNNLSVIAIKTDVTNPSDYFSDEGKNKTMEDQSMDLVLGSGALSEQVLGSRDEAYRAAKKCFSLLKSNGLMVLAGLGNSYLNSQDFTSIGFRVLNCSFPYQGKRFSYTTDLMISTIGAFNKQLYILEKP